MSRPQSQEMTLEARIASFKKERAERIATPQESCKKYFNFDDFSDHELEELFSENKEFLSQMDSDGLCPIHFFANIPTSYKNGFSYPTHDPRIFKIFSDLGLINLQDKDGDTALHFVTGKNYLYSELTDILLENRIDVNIVNNNGFKAIWYSPRNILALSKLLPYATESDLHQHLPPKEPDSYSFLDECLLNDDVDSYIQEKLNYDYADFINLKRAAFIKFILGLSYSPEGFGIMPITNELLIKQIGQKIDFSCKEKFLEIFQNLDKPFILKNGKKLVIKESSHPKHKVYLIFEYDKNDSLTGLYQCDGNLPRELKGANKDYGYGACYYTIKNTDKKDISDDLLKDLFQLEKRTENLYEFYKEAQLILGKYVATDISGKQIPPQKLILTKPQKRGNCSIKADNILFRLMLSLLYPKEMVFTEKNGIPCGSGYVAYKEYKQNLIHTAIENLLYLSGDEHVGKPYHATVLKTLKDHVFLQAIVKKDVLLVKEIEEIFAKNGIDFTQIKTSEGENFINIAIRANSPEVEKWLIEKLDGQDHSIINQPDDTRFSHLSNAVVYEKTLLAEKLITLGADTNVRDKGSWQNPAIYFCFPKKEVYKLNQQKIERLLCVFAENNADLNPLCRDGEGLPQRPLLNLLRETKHPGYKFLKELIEKSLPKTEILATSGSVVREPKSSICTIL